MGGEKCEEGSRKGGKEGEEMVSEEVVGREEGVDE